MPASTALPPEIKAVLTYPITVVRKSTIDQYGKVTYVSRGSYLCYPVEDTSMVIGLEGQQEMADVTLYIDSTDLASTDRITYNSVQRRIVSLQTWRDGQGAIWGQVAFLR